MRWTRFSPRIRRALARSRIRVDALIELDRQGPMHLSDLARAIGASPDNVKGAFHGVADRYRPEHSLVELEFALATSTELGAVYELTPRGVDVARALLHERQRKMFRAPPPRT